MCGSEFTNVERVLNLLGYPSPKIPMTCAFDSGELLLDVSKEDDFESRVYDSIFQNDSAYIGMPRTKISLWPGVQTGALERGDDLLSELEQKARLLKEELYSRGVSVHAYRWIQHTNGTRVRGDEMISLE